MKQVLQPLAWYLVLLSVLALASGVALSFATDTALADTTHRHGTSERLQLPQQEQKWAVGAPAPHIHTSS
jgi:hypothetical protein